MQEVADTLDLEEGNRAQRQAQFQKLMTVCRPGDSFHEHLAKVMSSFQLGLFAGGDEVDQVRDNLDLERWFRLLKGHERRIHGHKHAGVRIVQEGPTKALALDAHGPTADCSPLMTSYLIVRHACPNANVKR